MSELVTLTKPIFKCPSCVNSIPPENGDCAYSCKLKAKKWFKCVLDRKDYYSKKESRE